MLNLALQRKGAPTGPPPSGPGHKPGLAIMIGMGGHAPPTDSQTPNDTGNANEGAESAGDTVTCPNCGCEFNGQTGEIVNGEQYQGAPQGPQGPAPDAGPSGPQGGQDG